MLHLICTVRETNYQPISRYKNNNSQLLDDIADAYKSAIEKFYALGCRNLQLDDTSWGELCSEEKRAAYQARGFDLEQLAKDYVYLVNRANTYTLTNSVLVHNVALHQLKKVTF